MRCDTNAMTDQQRQSLGYKRELPPIGSHIVVLQMPARLPRLSCPNAIDSCQAALGIFAAGRCVGRMFRETTNLVQNIRPPIFCQSRFITPACMTFDQFPLHMYSQPLDEISHLQYRSLHGMHRRLRRLG